MFKIEDFSEMLTLKTNFDC